MRWWIVLVVTVLSSLAPEAVAADSASVGRPNAGALVGAVQLDAGEAWEVVAASHAWGTKETIASIVAAITAVHGAYPEGHPLHVGELSREFGGPLYPHRSHQSGRDVDLGYYYLPTVTSGFWYRKATPHTLDCARTWALLEALIARDDVEYVFIDRSIQRLLKDYARSRDVDATELDRIFQLGSRHPAPIVRHAWGHATHMHVRFQNPAASQRGAQVYQPMLADHRIGLNTFVVEHRATPADDLSSLVQRYGTSARAILRANHLRPIVAGELYVIPRRGRLLRPRLAQR